MGKGDKKTRKGKIKSASYGNARPHHIKQPTFATKTATPVLTPLKKAAPEKPKTTIKRASEKKPPAVPDTTAVPESA